MKHAGSVAELMEELKDEVVFLAQHLFRANWQVKRFESMRTSHPFPPATVGMVLDFAKNFTCTFQDEVQAAHWHHEQVILHPIVSYYQCTQDECEETVTESMVFISNDKNHDHHAVFQFTREALRHLTDVRQLPVQHVIQWTDGCSAQYKSKGPFSDISCALTDFACTLEQNFFGSRHGKGPSDGESAVVKHHATTTIKAGAATICDAKYLFDYCKQSKLHKQPEAQAQACKTHFFCSFFWVKSTDIVRQRNRPVKTLKGTRSLHRVKCVEQNVILTRNLSCFCNSCRSGVGHCENTNIAGNWHREELIPMGPQRQPPAAQDPPAVAAPQHQPAGAHDLPAVAAPQHQPAGAQDLPAVAAPQHQPAAAQDLPAVAAPQHQPAGAQDLPAVAAPQHQPAGAQDLPAVAALDVVPAVPATDMPAVRPSSPEIEGLQPKTGDFLEVELDGHNRAVTFFGKVLSTDLHVQFFEKKAESDLYVWSDDAWVSLYQVKRIVQPPVLAPTHALAFRFASL